MHYGGYLFITNDFTLDVLKNRRRRVYIINSLKIYTVLCKSPKILTKKPRTNFTKISLKWR